IPEFREQMTEVMRNQYRIQDVQRNLTRDVKVTPSDVRKYFNSLPEDSIPYVPLKVEVQIMTLNPAIPREEIENVKARLRDYTDRINKGETDFSTLAILYSEDPGSQARGGELGFFGRGHLEPEYAAVAFNLSDPKKVSKIVETQYGYHIIQLIEQRGDRVNTRHILLRPHVSDEDLTKSVNRLDSVRADIMDGKFTFEEIVPYVSQDKDTRANKGIMVNTEDGSGTTMWEMQQLPQEISKVVGAMKPGDISEPIVMMDPKRNREMVAMIKLTSRLDGHKANLSDDYQLIKGMYENAQREEILKKWLAKKISETYIKIEDGWADCTFQHDGWIKK
ncbi:MAG: peptidylprolyl isomerase, partial [Muribaculaceae bacterium]|nr:peptidylprolyl isomerase [Muribaculaceae bacterium]